MTQDQQKKPNIWPLTTRPHTKRGWLLWGLRWFAVIIFTLAFCVGLLLSVSWKILLCLAVIPVTYLCLPKKIQSWVWVCLTGVVLGLFIWVLLPELNKKNWKPYQFDHDLQALNNVHLSAGIDNAADRYLAILEEHDENIFLHELFVHEMHNTFAAPWNPEEYPELDTWLTGFEPAMEQLVEISKMEHCRFPIPHDMLSNDLQLKRLHLLGGWAGMLIRSANRDLYRGQTEQALSKLLVVPRMARHLYQQKTLSDQAKAFDLEWIGALALEAFMMEHGDDLDMLKQVEQAFAAIDPQWPGNWRKILAHEKLMFKNIAGNLYEINRKGRIRMSRNSIPALAKGLNFRIPYRLRKQNLSKAATIGLWLFMPSSPEGIGFDYYSRQVQRGEQLPRISSRYAFLLRGVNYKSIVDWRVMEQVQWYSALDGHRTRHEAIVRRIRILSALKQHFLEHKCWPNQLAELQIDDADSLIDPLCSKPFFYERLDEGFRLYSLGVNGVDDGGVNLRREQKDDILIWPGLHIEKSTDTASVDQ